MARGHVYRRRLTHGNWSSWYAVVDVAVKNGKRHQLSRSFPHQAGR